MTMEKMLLAFPDLCTGATAAFTPVPPPRKGFSARKGPASMWPNFPLQGYSVPCVCFQCPNAACMEACPAGAISRNEQDVVVVDREACTACGECAAACPYGMIELDDGGLAYKCDYCGGDPACVRECYPGALIFVAADPEQKKSRGRQMKLREPSGTPEEKAAGPGQGNDESRRSGHCGLTAFKRHINPLYLLPSNPGFVLKPGLFWGTLRTPMPHPYQPRPASGLST
jgi:Fe-S-cluster-containing hydrogenase component 2